MALVLADRVRETTTTTGTGSVTLGGAYTGFQTFSAGIGNANNTYYTIANSVSGEWEVGIGTYTTSGNTLSRDTVLASSNAGSLVVFTAGSKDVFVTQPAERAVYVNAANTQVSVPQLAATSIINSGLTTGRVTYATTGGLLTDSANLTFNGTTLTANTIGAFTLSGTVAGGGNQINNVIIGTSTPLAGAFTSLTASTTLGVTGVATFSAGTAALPAITTTGDTNTGIFFSAADQVAISTGGTQKAVVDASGNVGIGTASPSTYGKFAVAGQSSLGVDQADYANVLGSSGTVRVETAGSSTNPNLAFSTKGTGAVYFWRGGYGTTISAIIDGSGNVGIGTASPNASAILDAQSTTKGVRMPNMTTTQKNAISSPAAGLMVFDTTLAKLCVYSGSAWQTITSV